MTEILTVEVLQADQRAFAVVPTTAARILTNF
jgi:hypothetical protein